MSAVPRFSPNVHVIGSINVDYTTVFTKLPDAGETVTARSLTIRPGGKGANQAVAAARAAHVEPRKLECSVSLAGAIGDANPNFMSVVDPVLRGAHLDLTRVTAYPGQQTGSATILVGEDGENRIMVVPGANHQGMQPYQIDLPAAANVIPQFVQVFVFQGEIPFETSRRLLEHISKKREGLLTEIIFNPSPVAGIDIDALEGVTFLVLNESEMNALVKPSPELCNGGTPYDDLRAAALYFHDKGIQNVVLTRGKLGVFFSTPGDCFMQQAYQVSNVVDTTCAGDTFTGYLAYELARHMQDKKRLVDIDAMNHICFRAGLAAATCIQRAGAMQSIPWGWEIPHRSVPAPPTQPMQ